MASLIEQMADRAAQIMRERHVSAPISATIVCQEMNADFYEDVLIELGHRRKAAVTEKSETSVRQRGARGRVSSFIESLTHGHRPTGDEHYLNGSMA